MIEPINLDPLNRTCQLRFKCENCGWEILILLFTEGKKKRYIDVDSAEDMKLLKDLEKDNAITCSSCKNN